jgi:hypothetical protein
MAISDGRGKNVEPGWLNKKLEFGREETVRAFLASTRKRKQTCKL